MTSVLDQYRPREEHLTFCLDGELEGQLSRLVNAWVAAQKREEASNEPPDETRRLAAEIGTVKEAIEAATVTFTVRAVGRKVVEVLKRRSPPTAEQVARDLVWDAAEFVPRFLEVSVKEPKLTLEEWRTVYDEWADAITDPLFEAAWRVNHEVRVRPLTATGGDTTPGGGQNSTT